MLKLTVVEPIKNVRGIELKFEGKAVCQFSLYYRRTLKKFRCTEFYASTTSYVFGSRHGEKTVLPVGTLLYRFVFRIPGHAPYSVDTKYGNISYNIIANLDRVWSCDIRFVKPIIVIRREEPESFIGLFKPFSFENDKSRNCFSFGSGALSMTVKLKKLCFEIKESFFVVVEIANGSSYGLKYFTFDLLQIIQYRANNDSKNIRKAIVQRRSTGLQQSKEVSFRLKMEIPEQTLVSNYTRSSVLQITYELEVKAVTDGIFSISPSIRIPIAICSPKLIYD